MNDVETGVYVELSFLDMALTRGQNIIVLFIFGFEIISFIQPLFKKWVSHNNIINLPFYIETCY